MLRSLALQNRGEFTVFVVCLDELSRILLTKANLPNVVILPFFAIEENDDALLDAKSKRSMVEYYWTATPTILLRILERHPEIDILTYLDADLFFFSSPDPIYDELGSASVLIHEHRFPPRLAHLNIYGKFNVGLLCFRNDENGLKVLTWWRERCLEWCHANVEGNKFGDQAYLNDWPERFSGVVVLQNPGAGLGPWNHDRYKFSVDSSGVRKVDGATIVFYHFHSLFFVQPGFVVPTIHDAYYLDEKILRSVFVPYLEAMQNSLDEIREDFTEFSSGLKLPGGRFPALRVLANRRQFREAIQRIPPNQISDLENDWVLWRDADTAALETFLGTKSSGPIGVQASSSELDRLLAQAADEHKRGNDSLAKELLAKAARLAGSDARMVSEIGAAAFSLDDFRLAQLQFRHLTELMPHDPSVFVNLAAASLKLGQSAEFESALSRALSFDPNHLDALRLLAHHTFSSGRIQEATRAYDKILARTPHDLEVMLAKGVCCFKLADLDSARTIFEQILKLDPTNSLASENLQVVKAKLAQSGKSESSSSHSRISIGTKLNPESSRQEAPSVVPQGEAPNPNISGSNRSGRGLEKVLEDANAQMTSGNVRGACESLRHAAELAPKSHEILATLGSVLYQAGDWIASREALERAVELKNDSADYQTRLALVWLTLDRIPEFERVLKRALEIDPNWRPALKLHADMKLRKGQYLESAQAYNRILQRDPDNVEVILAMGVCFHQTGDKTTARIMFEKALQLEPGNAVARENLQVLAGASKAEEDPEKKNDSPQTPLISAIVSTYNSERFIRGCLEDLEAQTLSGQLEIIVVDSASQQNERKIVEEMQRRYANIVYIRSQERETVYGAWNRGIRAARGKYVTNSNTDDRHRRDALEVLVRKLEENPQIALAYADVIITDQENMTIETARQVGKYSWHDFNREALVKKGCFVGPQPVWRRQLHEEHGYFDAEFVSAGDYEFWMRLAKKHEFLHVRETLGLYLQSPTSIEHSNRTRAAQEIQIALSRHGAELLRIAGVNPASSTTSIVPAIAEGQVKEIEVPVSGRLGSLKKAHDFVRKKKYLKAWDATLDAIKLRPFHPDAFLQMADIALTAQDEEQAFICAQRLIQMTPKWDMAKKLYASLCDQKKRKRSKTKWTPIPAQLKKPRLTVCLIAKNEEEHLARCLASVKSIASQIVLVDTGSNDRTVEIAKEYGAEVYHFPWNDNFADARNAAHEHARGDWVLILDADEELPQESHEKLDRDMAAANVLRFRIPICNIHEASDAVTYVPRLFRNAPALFFVGRVHEQIYACVIARKSEWNMDAEMGTAKILHYGYDPGLVKRRQKIQRNLRLMERAVQELPNEAALLMNYGLDLVNDGRLEEGLEKYRDAFRIMAPHPAAAVLPEVRERLMTLYGVHALKAERFDEVLETMTSRLANDAGPTASMHFLAAVSLLKLSRAAEAIPHLEACLAKRDLPALTPPCHQIFKAGPHHLLAECYAKTGQNEKAEEHFKLALDFESESPSILHDYAHFLHRTDRSLDALQILHRVMANGVNNERIWHLGSFIANSKPEFVDFAIDWTEEAIKFFPDHTGIKVLRGEALLKAGRLVEALPLFQGLPSADDPSALAAILICQMAERLPLAAVPSDQEKEMRISREFVSWYRRLVSAKSRGALAKINAQRATLKKILPTAANMLDQALDQTSSS